MKTLHKLADWISGGEITRLTDELSDERHRKTSRMNSLEHAIRRVNMKNLSLSVEAEILRKGLHDIIAAQTPACANIGKKMAGIAQETLDRADAPKTEPVKVAA